MWSSGEVWALLILFSATAYVVWWYVKNDEGSL